jgi:glycerol-3-phosphate dehydrogenase (NAD(P)+)
MKAIVIGDGAWGTTLAMLLAKKGLDVSLWSAFPDYAEELARTRENRKFLPGVAIPESIRILSRNSGKAGPFELAIAGVPTQYARTTLAAAQEQIGRVPAVVSVAKGIENETLLRPSEIIQAVLEPDRLAVLSGPSHAEEVSRGLPTTVVAASLERDFPRHIQQVFSSDRFRVYTSEDMLGVELAGALKNVIAIAAGICEGLGFGDNSKAALITRGLVEMARLGDVMGARRSTFSGLAGMGDLITTCFSPFGRNLAVGQAIGRGEKLNDILARMEQVAEGVATTLSARALAMRHHVEMPITEEVHRVLFEDKPPRQAVSDLMRRGLKAEEDC